MIHDAEVLSMHLGRAGEGGPSLDARIHVFLMTDQVDRRGHFVLTHHTVVALSFSSILLRDLHSLNEQKLTLEPPDRKGGAGRE
jgi:hypothetical protein